MLPLPIINKAYNAPVHQALQGGHLALVDQRMDDPPIRGIPADQQDAILLAARSAPQRIHLRAPHRSLEAPN